ncbi:MAG: hypothetical protein MI867_07905 [Pseudomonadales bacterium]|nr:hypothetical protein [Pseudomonadales bacterium]
MKLIQKLSLLAMMVLLTACMAEEKVDLNVKLSGVKVTRLSNGDTINVETEGVNSGNLTYTTTVLANQ